MSATDKGSLSDRLSDEADLCRNDGADDIAALLDDARKELERLNAQRLELQSEREQLLERLAHAGVELRRAVTEERAKRSLDVHSCHLGCNRAGCVNERLRALNAEQAQMIETYLSDITRDQSEIARLRALVHAVVHKRHTYGWGPEADDAIEAARVGLGPNAKAEQPARAGD